MKNLSLLILSLSILTRSLDAKPAHTPLEIAAFEGQADRVARFLREGQNPEGKDKKNTAIYFAILNGHVAVVRLLLDAGVNPNLDWGKSGGTLLTNAVQFDRVEIVEMLLERGARVNAASGSSAVFIAKIHDRRKILAILLSFGGHLKVGEEESFEKSR